MEQKIVKAQKEHLSQVEQLYNDAKLYFKQNNIDQWQDGYPNKDSFLQDVENGESYVLIMGEQVLATFMLSVKTEPTYNKIYDGQWSCGETYGVIHRIAVAPNEKGKGVFGKIIEFSKNFCNQNGKQALRADTHEDNLSMQKALIKNGFTKCGFIYLQQGAKRDAFEIKSN